jgi:excisionase family DNA binding protein
MGHVMAERMGQFIAEQERLAFSITEAAALLGVGRTLAYQMAKSGELPTVRLGRRVVVPRAQLKELLAGEVDL